MPPLRNLTHYLTEVYRTANEAVVAAGLHPGQQQLLLAVLDGPCRAWPKNPLDDPLSTIYFIASERQPAHVEQAYHVGAFCLFFLLSADLFDDIQDDDLAGTIHADVDSAITINNAIALTFLATEQLRRAMALDDDPGRRARYLEMYSRVSLTVVAGQHRDLLGNSDTPTPAEVLEMQQAKTSSMALLCESGALLGGCDAATQQRYRMLGEQLAQFVQVRDDLRDVFGKDVSPDLRTGKINYPVACFMQSATPQQRAEFDALVLQLPTALPQIRALLYASGAVKASALALEACRNTIHELVVGMPEGDEAAPLRVVLDIVDGLASSVYAPKPLNISQHMWQPRGSWHECVRESVRQFCERTRDLGLPTPPRVRPWHRPPWMYIPNKRTIFYPDVQGLRGEVLPFHASLMGIDDLDQVASIMQGLIPTFVAHEMFHFWRDGAGRLSDDHWHEEWAANRLAVAYSKRFHPDALRRSVALAQRVLRQHARQLDNRALEVLDRCHNANQPARGYRMSMLAMAVTSAEMIRRFAQETLDFETEVQQLLAPRPHVTGLSA